MKTDPMDLVDLRALSPDSADRGAAFRDEDIKPVGYYGEPLLKGPHWGWNVVTYLFLGGIMGGSSSLAVLADESTEDGRVLARNARYLSLVLAVACPAILISHLGRVERFLNMMRVVKLKSPMSLGVWGLVLFGNTAAIGAVGQASRDGLLPSWMQKLAPRMLFDVPQALFGSFIAGYTGVLISATAMPIWAKGKRHIPAMSVCSGIASACATHGALLAIEGRTGKTLHRLERLELFASLAEVALILDFKRHAGDLGKPMFGGPRGAKLTNVTLLCGIGAASLINVLPGRYRWKTLLASALTLAGGYVLRESLIEAGKASANDPKAAFRQPE